jgi:hypothetical protein
MDAALTRLVWQRAQGRCEYCQMPEAADDAPFEVDHIIARKHLGPTIASNLCLSWSVRLKLKASQELLAKFMGVDTETVSSWEDGKRKVPLIARRYLDDLVDIPELWTARTGIAVRGK